MKSKVEIYMTLKKFLIPNIVIASVLFLFWFAGIDPIVSDKNSDRDNIEKYVQTQQRIVDNYVDEISIEELFKSSIKGLTSNLKDSTIDLSGTPADTSFSDDLEIKNIRDSHDRFEDAYMYISNNYPDENMSERTTDAIKNMLNNLDPHSVYIRPEEGENVDQQFEGKFEGIGVQFDIIQDTITVVTAISGGPSDKLGIMSGDRIIEINDSSSVGFDIEDVSDKLRGPKGTEVDVTIKRPNVDNNLNFTIERDEIPLHTVDTNYMLDEQTGYVKINRFAATTHEEFMEAMDEMKEEGMERIVLDLRNNPGGYLQQAIAIAEEFFPSGTKLLSTDSRHTRYTDSYYSQKDGNFKDEQVIVLVNEGSASASEIVSGAIQDHDRGLIVGARTFGKGLVQQQYELPDDSKIRVTISKYYTPSGRLIQKPYNKGREEYALEIYERQNSAETDAIEFIEHVPDSLTYQTDAGRKVYGGGGVIPDHIVQRDTSQSAAVVNFMRQQQVGFNFVRDFLDDHGDEFRDEWKDEFQNFRTDFEWSDQDVNRVFEMMQENNMVVSDTVSTPDFEEGTLYIPEGHFEEVEWMSRGVIKAEIARQVWGMEQYYQIFNDIFDTTLEKSMTMWDEVRALEEYASNHTKEEFEYDYRP